MPDCASWSPWARRLCRASDEISIDPRALAFTVVVSLLSGLLFGLIPALKYAGPKISLTLRAGGRTLSHSRERHRARNILVVAQVALALVLLVSAGLMIRTFQALRTVEPGFTHAEHLQTMRISIPASLDSGTGAGRTHAERYCGQARGDPRRDFRGVRERCADGNNRPQLGRHLAGRNRNTATVKFLRCGYSRMFRPGFFTAVGTRLIAGRDYTWTDLYDRRPVAMVSENLARELWGTPSAAVGQAVPRSSRIFLARGHRRGSGRPRQRRA